MHLALLFTTGLLTIASHAADRVTLVAGGGTREPTGIAAVDARIKEPFGIAFDSGGNAYVIEMEAGQRLLKIAPNGIISICAGTGQKGSAGDGGPASAAQFDGPHSLAIAPSGDIYIADTWNCRVRKLDARTERISTIAGTGEKGFSGDGGPATQAKVGGIYCVALDAKGSTLLLADLPNRRIRAVDLQSGIIRTVAGNGEKGVPKDGVSATDSPLVDPRAVAVDRSGNIYILERSGNALRVVDPQGKIRTAVNASGAKGSSGDGGDALKATMNGPKHLCVDGQNNVIIADAENHLIRKYQPATGRMIRVAGTGTKGTRGVGGPPDQLELNRPHGVFAQTDGALYIVDSYNHRVVHIR